MEEKLEQAPTKNLSFGTALYNLKNGYKVAREGWNGKKMYLRLVKDWEVKETNLSKEELEKVMGRLHPFIGMKTAQDTFVPWLASQTDILAEDWSILTDPE